MSAEHAGETMTVTPPPRTTPQRRERGTGKLTRGWDLVNPQPYKFDGRGRPLWKFVFRHGGAMIVIPARDWKHANDESLKALGRWDQVAAAKQAKREKRERARTGIVPTVGWRWSDLKREWLTLKREGQDARTSTIDGYEAIIERHLDPFFLTKLGDPPLTGITRHTITACKRWFERKGSPAQWNRLATLLYMLFDLGIEDEAIATNPVRRKRHRNGRRRVAAAKGEIAATIVTAVHLDTVLAEADRHEDPRVAVAALLAGFGGLRLDELVHVRVKDVTVTDALVDVQVATDFPCTCPACAADENRHWTKNGKARWVPLLPEHGQRLAAHLDLLKSYGLNQPDMWLLAALHTRERSKAKPGDMVRRDTIAAQLEAVVARALGLGPERVTTKAGKASDRYRLPKGERVHLLRKAARTRFSHLGLPSETIDLVMGHTLAGMRATYTHQDRTATYETLCVKAGVVPAGPRLVKSA